MRSPSRGFAFEAVDNFRDVGGARTVDGGRIRLGRVYRSAHHGRASAADLEALASLGLTLVIDLRRPEEREREPCRRPEGFAAAVLEDERPGPGQDAFQDFLRSADLTEAAMRGFLLGYYRRAPFDPRIQTVFRRAFRALADTDGAALVHCAAGKDRTGLFVALLHHMLGVPFEAALEDYLRTNDPDRIEARLPRFLEHVAALTGRTPEAAAARAALGVEAAYLETSWREIRERAGSIGAYLSEEIGLGSELQARLRERLVEAV